MRPWSAAPPSAFRSRTRCRAFVPCNKARPLAFRLRRRRHPRQWLLLFGLLILYVIQLLLATRVDGKVADPDAVNNVGVLVIVFFAIGIARAWDLVGAPETGLIGTLRQLRSRPGDDEQP